MKSEILKMLKESSDYLSGQQLCEIFGVSRTAVWKAVRQLEEEGYKIEAVRNKGYRLTEEADVITQAELKSMFHTKWIGNRLEYFDETDSTNIRARRLAEEGAPHGTLVVADSQTAGKGRRGRAWTSPKGVGIWMSMVLRPPIKPSDASMLTLVAGMAVVKGVKTSTGLNAMIKWPNDAVLSGKKICGILTEMSTEEECVRYVITGIGINVNVSCFPEEIAEKATSLKEELGENVKRSPVIAAVADAFEEYYDIYLKTCDMSGLKEAYNRWLVNLNRQVTVLDPRGQYRGRALGIDHQGSLLVQKEDGGVETVISGEVSVRGIYGYV
ncbi:MAG: biotin--[acetyl-CoA-carboxylase] ligase [Clostridium sp.]|nr:biotin--[acetyl-CoA-carboxylase] ligase [Clostridium sp.]